MYGKKSDPAAVPSLDNDLQAAGAREQRSFVVEFMKTSSPTKDIEFFFNWEVFFLRLSMSRFVWKVLNMVSTLFCRPITCIKLAFQEKVKLYLHS